MNTFDVIMESCPFIKQAILDKIETEVQPLKDRIAELELIVNQQSSVE